MLSPLAKFSMAGRHVLITGASSGLGHHFSQVLAAAGASSLVLAARRVDKLEALQQKINESHPDCNTLTVEMDVASNKSIQDAFSRMETELAEPLNVLVNNAGIGAPDAFLHLQEETWDSVLGTNLKGAVFVAQHAAQHMVKHDVQGGSIVNVASIMSLRPGRRHVSYCASKAGLLHASKCMAGELWRKGIRVNCICPGYFVTDINRHFLQSDEGAEYLASIPPGRAGDYTELDGALLLLASPAGSFMNGTHIVIDGGHTNSAL